MVGPMTLPSRSALLIHGAFCGPWYFKDFAAALESEGWRTRSPALPHHDTPSPGGVNGAVAGASLRDYLEDLRPAAADRPVVIGHSMGGVLALQLAALGHASAVVLLAPARPWGVPPTTQEEVAAAGMLMRLDRFWERAVPPSFEVAAATSLDRIPAERQRPVFDQLVPESGRALFELLFWPMDHGSGAAVAWHRVRCPVLVLVGDQDKVTPASSVRGIAGLLPRAEFAVLPGLSHFIFGEPGEMAVTEAVRRWLAGLAG